MRFDKNISIQGQLDGLNIKAKRLGHLLQRSHILEEALSKDSYNFMEVSLRGMSPDLVIPSSFGLSQQDSVDLLVTLNDRTDAEIVRLQTELGL